MKYNKNITAIIEDVLEVVNEHMAFYAGHDGTDLIEDIEYRIKDYHNVNVKLNREESE